MQNNMTVWIVARQAVPNFKLRCYSEESAKRWVDFIMEDLNDLPVVEIVQEVA